MSSLPSYQAAFEEWRRLLRVDCVLDPAEAAQRFGASTSSHSRRIAGALCPESADEVSQIVRIAQMRGVPLYPISTGHNWGYGTALPPRDDCVILDLSRMNRIVACDAKLGTVTIQPGVTQEKLRQYLDEGNLAFLVPVHGGGPKCSLIGNAVERGFGITPHTDHFLAVLSLEAVLPTGEIYRSPLNDLGAPEAARAFRWGVGPYLDGLFTQSNLGIVTEMTIALARRPECVEVFYFWVPEDRGLENAVEAVHDILQKLGSVVGAINLMDRRRQLSMVASYPFDRTGPGTIMPEEMAEEIGRRHDLPAWLGVGTLYGERSMLKSARSIVKRCLKTTSSRTLFLTPAFARRVWKIAQRLPLIRNLRLVRLLPKMIEAMNVADGIPSEIALRLTTWKSPQPPAPDATIDPVLHGTGLIWYTPLIPMRPDRVRAYVAWLRSVCQKHGIEPLITLTSVSERCFDSSIPLLFDKNDAGESEQADRCYRELIASGQATGFVPYRIGADYMDLLFERRTPFGEVIAKLKAALDPSDILAPGRYAPTTRPKPPDRSRENAPSTPQDTPP